MSSDVIHSLTFGDVARENARRFPTLRAVVDGDVALTYPEIDKRSTRLANALAGHGLRRGDRVLWLGQNSFRVLEALIAAGKLGAILCPANWRMSAQEMAFVLDDLEPRVVIWQEEEIGNTVRQAREMSSAYSALWLRHDGGDHSEYEAVLTSGSGDDEQAALGGDAPLLALYTSAFAGKPNAALLSHSALLMQDLVVARVQDVDSSTVFLNSGPLFHIGTFMLTSATFHHGGTNVFVRRSDARELCRLIEQQACTHAFVPRPLAEEMALVADREGRDLGALARLAHDWANPIVAPSSAPWSKRPSGYGQTEVAGLATFNALDPPAIGTSGRSSPIAIVRIVDPDGTEVPQGVVGEIVIRGPLAMIGFHARPEITRDRRREGWHHTGDLGRREPDGSITFVRPASRMIKSAAENIYPEEVEACVRSHPGVADVCVLGIPDPRWDQAVKAVVVPVPGARPTAEEIIEHCRSRIASYKKPRTVEFARELPRTPAGFLDRDLVDATYGGGGYPGAAS